MYTTKLRIKVNRNFQNNLFNFFIILLLTM
ncbi:hypothetical protein VP249E411_P0112 [Vibrio phage 249E41-1]|nr:hypothetical protein VP249E411_P0112 [Vibrio phage 249E41-1]